MSKQKCRTDVNQLFNENPMVIVFCFDKLNRQKTSTPASSPGAAVIYFGKLKKNFLLKILTVT